MHTSYRPEIKGQDMSTNLNVMSPTSSVGVRIPNSANVNDRNINDLLSSFHLWSLLLLEKFRGYRSSVTTVWLVGWFKLSFTYRAPVIRTRDFFKCFGPSVSPETFFTDPFRAYRTCSCILIEWRRSPFSTMWKLQLSYPNICTFSNCTHSSVPVRCFYKLQCGVVLLLPTLCAGGRICSGRRR